LGGRASFAGAEMQGVDFGYARLLGGDLSGVRAKRTSLFLADLAGATLRRSAWGPDEDGRNPPRSAWLCRTAMPDGTASDRDCPAPAGAANRPSKGFDAGPRRGPEPDRRSRLRDGARRRRSIA